MQTRTICDGRVTINSNFLEADEWIEAHLPTEAHHPTFETGWDGNVRIESTLSLFNELQRVSNSASDRNRPRLYMDETYEHIAVGDEQLFLVMPGASESHPHALVGSYATGWKIVVPDRSKASMRQTLRSLRSVLRGYHLNCGGLLMHGAAAGGALFLGPSGAGKTSSAIRFACHTGQPIVSTDRTVVRAARGEEDVLAIGGPEVMRLGAGLVYELDGSLLERGSSTRTHQDLDLVLNSGQGFGSKAKLELTFDDVNESLGIRSQDSTAIAALVLPRATKSGGGVMRKSDDGLTEEIAAHLLHPDATHGYPLAPSMLDFDIARSHAIKLLGNLPVYELAWPLRDRELGENVFTELAEMINHERR